MVKQACQQVWKAVVQNPPRTLKELLPTLMTRLIEPRFSFKTFKVCWLDGKRRSWSCAWSSFLPECVRQTVLGFFERDL